jgi:alpha-galactosidase
MTMKANSFIAKLCVTAVIVSGCLASDSANVGSNELTWLSDLDISKTQQGWGSPQKDMSVERNPLHISGQSFVRGLGTHADSVLYIELAGGARRFKAMVGVDDEVDTRGTIEFRVLADGRQIYKSGLMRGGQAANKVDLDVSGVQMLLLAVDGGEDGISYDHADWADATFEVTGPRPKTVYAPREDAVILTPKPSPKPRINGARIFGVRPGSPVLYSIAASGERPMEFSAENLPRGLSLDPQSGQLTGRIDNKGEYRITLIAKNEQGEDKRILRLVVGDKIALTPPMGWNSWNCWACAVEDQKIREAARAMVNSGLVNHGWQYINIDDCWMVNLDSNDPIVGGKTRDEQGMILTNKKFPDMKDLTDYVHRLGLKVGTYISPGPWTCQHYEGSYKHEQLDAQRFAQWGFDYLKYDWCGYGSVVQNPTLEQMKEPYRLMRTCLDKVDRDIVYSLCQYGMGDVWKWGAEVGGNCWRTTGDITDTWGSMSGIGFSQDKCTPYASPGHWNDPDMLVVGKVGWGPSLRDTHLTPNEQYTHISLWCLLSAPLLIGCDLANMDDFTLSLLTNDEVLEVNQDPLGQQAGRVTRDGLSEVWAKKMEDGSTAVGLFNRDGFEKPVTAGWSDLGLTGKMRVRDLWRQKDLNVLDGEFQAMVPRHGVVLVRMFPAEVPAHGVIASQP